MDEPRCEIVFQEMNIPRYLIGSSFYDSGKNGSTFRRDFAHIWQMNKLAWSPAPTRIVIVSEGDSNRPMYAGTDIVRLTGNLGHCEDLVYGRKPHEFSSWSASMCALAMIAYDDEANFVYAEEDMLGFGPVIERMTADMGNGDMVFGRKMNSAPWMPCSQSLFMVRHGWIPQFVAAYLSMGGERNPHNLGEAKFAKIEQKFGQHKIKRLSFGCDRERPIPWDDPVWFCQQWTPAELEEARRRNLI
jgi:hypothetical protein